MLLDVKCNRIYKNLITKLASAYLYNIKLIPNWTQAPRFKSFPVDLNIG